MAPRTRVFTIPASVPFLPRLIEAFLDGTLVAGCSLAADPLALAAATIYLPTRRACRLARDVLLDALDVDGALLPQILAIGDVDEDELAFADAAAGPTAEAALELPPALGSLERIAAWSRVFGMVNSAPGFNQQPSVINGFSDLILELFGPQVGAHCRSAVGLAELPFNIPVEIEGEVEIFGSDRAI